MIEDYADKVGELYNFALNSAGEERDRRIYDLTLYLRENWSKRTQDLLNNPAREISYRTIRNLTGSEAVIFHLQRQLDVIEEGHLDMQAAYLARQVVRDNDFEPFYCWINARQENYQIGADSSVGDVLSAVDEVRSKLIEKSQLSSILDFYLSNIISGLYELDTKDVSAVLNKVTDNREHQLRLIAHLCSERALIEYFSLLSPDEVKKVALHFYCVPFIEETVSEEWYMNLLKFCKNARIVEISHPIHSLCSEDLPPHVEELKFSECDCSTLSLSLPKLKKFVGPSSMSLRSVELQAPLLTRLEIHNGQNVQTLRLDTPHLESLILDKTALSHLTLDTPFLHELVVMNSSLLNAITLVHSDRLRNLSFEECTSLRFILEPGRALPNCRKLTLYNCPAAIPQVPSTAEVFTGTRQNQGDVVSFRVNPKLLEENPLQMLIDFGKIFEKQTFFPNIVWINPLTGAVAPGMDAGGLRRHFVATLTEKLPPVLEDKFALETYGRLIGFAAESSLLLGTSLPLEFYYELLSEAGCEEITKGVKASLGPHWKKWKKKPQEDAEFTTRVRIFADQVQGRPVTAENLFPLLQFDGEGVTQEYFWKFFNEFPLLIDERVFQLKHFHQLMRGSLSLEGRPITIHVKGEGTALPSIHACSGEMEIPTYPDYQTFKEKLMWAFCAHDTFETI